MSSLTSLNTLDFLELNLMLRKQCEQLWWNASNTVRQRQHNCCRHSWSLFSRVILKLFLKYQKKRCFVCEHVLHCNMAPSRLGCVSLLAYFQLWILDLLLSFGQPFIFIFSLVDVERTENNRSVREERENHWIRRRLHSGTGCSCDALLSCISVKSAHYSCCY